MWGCDEVLHTGEWSESRNRRPCEHLQSPVTQAMDILGIQMVAGAMVQGRDAVLHTSLWMSDANNVPESNGEQKGAIPAYKQDRRCKD